MSVTLDEFRRSQPFPLDPFQLEACESLDKGRGVLVAAPTGAGKSATVASKPVVSTTLPSNPAG